ncbi:MAG: hypothetical protein AAF802_32920, partial [Planctomycetota bacterium]
MLATRVTSYSTFPVYQAFAICVALSIAAMHYQVNAADSGSETPPDAKAKRFQLNGVIRCVDGTPASGLQVIFDASSDRIESRTTKTDSDGRYRFAIHANPNLVKNFGRIRCQFGEQMGIQPVGEIDLKNGPNSIEITPIRMAPIVRRSIKVIDSTDNPVQDAKVIVSANSSVLQFDEATDSMGRAIFKLPSSLSMRIAISFKDEEGLAVRRFSQPGEDSSGRNQNHDMPFSSEGETLRLTGARTLVVKAIDENE